LKVRLETDGGFTGRGIGFVAIDGREVTASDGFRVCRGTLLDAEEQELAPLLDPLPPANETAWPDQIRYTLTVGDRSTSWNGEDVPVRDVLWKIRDRVMKE